MNYWLIALTFLSVNLDFFFMLLFLLKKFKTAQVIGGYLLGNLVLITLSYFVGQTLAVFLPEWLLGALGILPIYLAFKDDDDDDEKEMHHRSGVWNVFLTYLSVCAGCNLSIFLPVLARESLPVYVQSLVLILVLSALMVLLIKAISKIQVVSEVMEKYGEKLMKVCYIAIGLYVFWDSGLITHLIALL
jgi:cadmium resistance protein CadD (predicted permease)